MSCKGNCEECGPVVITITPDEALALTVESVVAKLTLMSQLQDGKLDTRHSEIMMSGLRKMTELLAASESVHKKIQIVVEHKVAGVDQT